MRLLPGTVRAASPGHRGFDCNTPLDRATAEKFRASGFAFAVRYVSRAKIQPPHDLTAGEAEAILATGLTLMPVQHVAPAGWSPDEALGRRNGATAARHVATIGFAPGVNVWLDLEGVREGIPAGNTIAYCNAWFAEIREAGFTPGLYVGPAAGLGARDLATKLDTRHLWRSGHDVPDLPGRGYQMLQTIPPPDQATMHGIAIDWNLTRDDALGGAVMWQAG
jgi:hypothetical protein